MICICRGTACHTRNSRDLLAKAVSRPGPGQAGRDRRQRCRQALAHHPDRKFTIRTVACFGQCALAPVVEMNHHILSHVNERTLQREVKLLKQGGK